MPTESAPKSPKQKAGWALMLLGFLIVALAGVAYFEAPRTGNLYLATVGNYMMATGLLVYVIGRVLRWRGRAKP
jgi:hypothetical protein